MIRNLIFDMGRVLMEYDPAFYVNRVKPDTPEDRELLLRETFHHVQWHQMDAGELNERAMYESVCQRIPERLHEKAYQLIFNWNVPVYPVKGMEELLRDCYEAGYHLYLLSNASERQPVYWPRVPGNQYFEGTVVSALEKTVKPDLKIFQILLDRYNLKADECLFIDDLQRNIDGAARAGIAGYLFDGDAEKLRRFIRKEGRL